jgi:hypothetical protein
MNRVYRMHGVTCPNPLVVHLTVTAVTASMYWIAPRTLTTGDTHVFPVWTPVRIPPP